MILTAEEIQSVEQSQIDYWNERSKKNRRATGKCNEYFLTNDFREFMNNKFYEYSNQFFDGRFNDFDFEIEYWDNFVSNFSIRTDYVHHTYLIQASRINHKFTIQKYLRDMLQFMIVLYCAMNDGFDINNFIRIRKYINKTLKEEIRPIKNTKPGLEYKDILIKSIREEIFK